ncbi:PAS domain S-box protein [Desulfococcus sp.]|uniref:sensor histidine kinase n=1 Tax=Desulfococcus sp. TaxID=2025834 RepID=UPI003593CDBF
MRFSEHQAIPPKDAASASIRQIYLLAGGIIIILSGLVVYGFYMGVRLERIDSPLIIAVHELQLEAGSARLLIDNALNSQMEGKVENAWRYMDQALWYFQRLCATREKIGHPILTHLPSELDKQLETLSDKITQFKSSTRHVISAKRNGKDTAGLEMKNREDFNALMAYLNEMERSLKAVAGKNQRHYFIAYSGVVGIFVVLMIILAVGIKKSERQRTRNLQTLAHINERLSAEIEERQKAQEALKASETLFRDIFRTSPEAINISRLKDGMILDINEGFTTLTGWSQADAVRKTVEDLKLWKNPGDRKEFIDDLRKNGFVRNLATHFITRSGSVRSVLLSSKIFDLKNEPHILTVTRDITEIKAAEARLKQSEETFRSFFESAADMIHMLDPEGRILMTNPAALDRLQYSAREMFGRKLAEFMSILSGQAFRGNLQPLLSNGFHRGEYEFIAKDGSTISVDASDSCIRDETDTPAYIISFQKDITERKLAEWKLNASYTFLAIANRHTEMTPVLEDFIKEIREITDCQAVAVRILNETGSLPYAATHGFDPEFCPLKKAGGENNTGICKHILDHTAPQNLNCFTPYGSFHHNQCTRFWGTAPGYEKDPLHNPCCQFGFESLALIPIRSGNESIGLIHVADRRENQIPFDIVDILEGGAMQLGSAIQRIRAENALKASYGMLEKKVQERTEALLQTNAKLKQEIAEHLKTEQSLLHYQVQLRKLSAVLLKTGELERRRIATEIHDRIGQTLAIAKIQLGALRAAASDDTTLKAIDDIRDLVAQTIKDTRSLTFELSPPVLYELGLISALQWLAENLGNQSHLIIHVKQNHSDETLLDGNARELLFRTVRELLLNAVKHARASQAIISIRIRPDHVQATVSDDGVGFSPENIQAEDNSSLGFGLFSIQEQLNHHGGRLTIDSSPGKGARMTIDLPLTSGELS